MKGVFLNFILYSFFRVFPIFDPRVFFSVFTLTLHAYIYKSVFKPSPFTFLAILLMVRELRVKGGEGSLSVLFCTFSHLNVMRKAWLWKGNANLLRKRERGS